MLVRRAWLLAFALFASTPIWADGGAWPQYQKSVAEAKRTMMTDPGAALEFARTAVAVAEKQARTPDQQQAVATALWLESEALTRTNKIAEARAALDQAIAITSGDHKLSKLDGDLALSLARNTHNSGDVALSLKSYLKAYDLFVKTSQPRGQAMALQGLGVIYEEAGDFSRAISYYSRAAEVYAAEPALQLSLANNVGFALQHAGRHQEAVTYFRKALAIAKSMDSPFLKARVLSNIAAAEAKLHKYFLANLAADQALILLGSHDDSGWATCLWGIKAEVAFSRGNAEGAIADLNRAFQGVDLRKSVSAFRDSHELAWHIYQAVGNYPLAMAHLEAFKRLDDEARSLAASANLALMSARFDFANQKLEIERLKTEQIQREASLKESRAATQRVLLVSLIVLAMLVIVWISWRHLLMRKHRDIISQANTELTRILGERDLEIVRRVESEGHLRVAMEAAETANRAKTQFLANMSHELRTPLNAIIGFSELLATGMMPQNRVQEYSLDINDSGRKLLAILADILDTACLDAGSVALAETEVSLGRTVELAVAKVAAEIKKDGQTINVKGDTSLRLRGDGDRLRQIVEKLVSNAVKFSGPMGTVGISLTGAPDGGIDLTVSDDGIGIPTEQLSHIMDRFGQIESTYARSHGGIGLGLPIVKSLVTLHGGSLRITSELEKGTTVHVHLPAERRLPAVTRPERIVAA